MSKRSLFDSIPDWLWTNLALAASACFVLIFLSRWNSFGPYFFPPYAMNPQTTLPIPPYLQTPDNLMAFLPIMLALGLCLILRYIPATNTTRLVFKILLLLLGIRYFIWRSVVTLNLVHPIGAAFSLALYSTEVISFISFCLYTVQSIWTTTDERTQQADRFAEKVGKSYKPSVDVFVPTHDEDISIVRRTVIGCQAMDYDNKTVYISNDGYNRNNPGQSKQRHRDLQKLARELGCYYIYFTKNQHRKAGNLNHAYKKTQGELIVVMDADFVPYRYFLKRTLGFFDPDFQEQVDLVQTPQHFYNPDYHCRNLGLEGFLPNDMEHFYSLLQPNRDQSNGVICCGSSYVIRRTALEKIGGFYTRCVVEDFQTSLRLLCQGSRIVFLNEILSMGESPRTYREFIKQRLRWLQGNVQVYFCNKDIAIWSKLNWIQLSFLISQGIHCCQSVLRIVFLVSPALSLFSGISPVNAPWQSACFFFLPFWLLLVVIYGWAANYRVSYFWNEIYEVVFCFPAFKMLFSLLWKRDPFASVNTVATQKQQIIYRKQYNFIYTLPLLILLGLNVALGLFSITGLLTGLWLRLEYNTPALIFWVTYNTVILIVAILSSIDQLETRTKSGDRFPLETRCQVKINDAEVNGGSYLDAETLDLSEGGARIRLKPKYFDLGKDLTLTLSESNSNLSIQAQRINDQPIQDQILRVKFIEQTMTMVQRRSLVQMLYTKNYDFHRPKPPTTIDSTLAIFQAVVMLKPLMTVNRRHENG